MAATVAEIRQGLAEAVTITGLRSLAYVSDSINTPCLFVFPPERIRYDYTLAGGSHEYRFPLRLYVGRVDEKGAQARLDAYCSPTGEQSVHQAIEDDHTLGGRVALARVEEARGYGPYQSGNSQFVGIEFVVSVIAQP